MNSVTTFYFEVSAMAGLGHNAKENKNANAYVKVTSEFSEEKPEEEVFKIEERLRRILAAHLDISEELIKSVPREYYLAQTEEVADIPTNGNFQ